MRVSDWIMQRLADTGLRHVFLLPGGGAMYLNDALACEKRLIPVPCHHEQACGIAAEAYGRTGHPNNPGFGLLPPSRTAPLPPQRRRRQVARTPPRRCPLVFCSPSVSPARLHLHNEEARKN